MSVKDSKTRKKIPTASPSPVESMKATTLPKRSTGAQRSRSAFVNAPPSTTELIRMFTEASALTSSPLVKKNKKQQRKIETTSETESPRPRPSRKDEIFRALKAQAQAGAKTGSESPVARFLAKAEEALSSPERVALPVDIYGKPMVKKRTGSKTLSGILHRVPQEVPTLSVNTTQSSEGPKKNAAAVVVKKKKTLKTKSESSRQAEYLAAAEIEDLLGMPISIQNQLRQVQRELRLKKELPRCNLNEDSQSKNIDEEGPDGDDLLFPPIMSPKHDDYPILEDHGREETAMDAMKYVHNALALWVVSNNNSESGTPMTVEETDQLLPDKIQNQTNTNLIDGLEEFLVQDLQSPPFSSSKNAKIKGPKSKPALTKKRSTRPPTRNSAKNLAEISTPSCPSTPTLDENGNQTSDTELVSSSLKLLCSQVASTQTFSINNPVCTQTGSSLTSVNVQPETQKSNVSVSDPAKLEDSKHRECEPSLDFQNTSESKVATRTTSCGVQVGQMASETRPSSSALGQKRVSNNALLDRETSRPSVGSTCEGPVAQRSTEMTLDPDSNNNDLMRLASSAKIQMELASAARIQQELASVARIQDSMPKNQPELASIPKSQQELASMPKIQPEIASIPKIQQELASVGKIRPELPSIQQEISPTKAPPESAAFGCYINEESKEMGSSFEKISSGAQATDNLYSSNHFQDPRGNNSGGDTPFQVIGEVKCYEPDSQQTVACQPDSPSVHTVGVTGVAKTWSLTAYNHPVRSRPIKAITPLLEALGYSASTQTIDETHAECQTGGSYGIFTDYREGHQECCNEEDEEASEEWDDDIRMHAADEVLDSESLLEMSGKIVQHINDLDLGTNIEKVAHTLTSTVRAMTEIITDLVVTEYDSSTCTNDDEEGAEEIEVVDEVLNQQEEENFKKFVEEPDEPGEPEKVDSRMSEFQDKRYPAEFYPEELNLFDEKPQLDPTLSTTSL